MEIISYIREFPKMLFSHWRKFWAQSSTSPASHLAAGGTVSIARVRWTQSKWIVLVLVLCSWSSLNFAQDLSNDTVDFDIPQQRADLALIAFAEQANQTLVFSFDETSTRTSNQLSGQYEVVEALRILLAGTGLSISMGGKGQLSVAHDDRSNLESNVNSKRKGTFFSRLGMAVNAFLVAGSAVADDAGSASVDSANVIEEIVVTALKRSQSVEDVPASISAISSQDLADKGVRDMNDIQFIVPSLHFGGFLGSQNISIRGIGEFNGQPGVAVSLDGIYQPRATTAQLTQLDLQRVEVLRGPQGTLYGRNSNGGVVNFVSGAPTQERGGYLKVGYAEFDETRVEGVYSGGITDNTSIRIAANYTDINEGWVENQVPGARDLMEGSFSNFRIKLNSQLADNFKIDLMYARSEIEGPMDHYAWMSDNRELAIGAGVPQLEFANITLEPRKQYADTEGDSDRVYEVFSVIADWDLSFGTLRSISAYQEYQNDKSDDRDSTDLTLYEAFFSATTESFSQEFNLSGSNDSIDWVVGVFYADDQRENVNFFEFDQPVLGFPTPAALDYQRPVYDTKSKAIFVDATWNVTDRARLSAGVRRTEDELSDEHSIEFFLRIPDLLSIGKICDSRTDVDWGATTYRAVGEYDTSDSGNVYFSYSEGYKAGGVVSTECTPAYDPEEVAAYEFGYKGQFNDGQTRLSAAVFYYDYTDFQVAQIIGLASATINAGDAEVTGAELEVLSQLNDRWTLNAAVTLLDSEYGDFLNTDGLNPGLGVQQLKGNRLNNSPETSINFGASYHTPLASGGSLTLRADVAYRSKIYFREFNQSEDSQGSYTVVNLNAIWESNDGLWTGRLFAKNLTDEDYITGLVGSSSNGGRLGSWGPPRQVGLEVTRYFGSL